MKIHPLGVAGMDPNWLGPIFERDVVSLLGLEMALRREKVVFEWLETSGGS
jgi:hypothetical protein